MKNAKSGKIVQIVGPVVDVKFSGDLPRINHAVVLDPGGRNLTAEVQQHLEGGLVRTLVLGPAEGLKRGLLGRAVMKGDILVPAASRPRKRPADNPFFDDVFNFL